MRMGEYPVALRSSPQAFAEYTEVYMQRVEELIEALLNGRLHKAKELCKLDFAAG